jgi:hypothetical protein
MTSAESIELTNPTEFSAHACLGIIACHIQRRQRALERNASAIQLMSCFRSEVHIGATERIGDERVDRRRIDDLPLHIGAIVQHADFGHIDHIRADEEFAKPTVDRAFEQRAGRWRVTAHIRRIRSCHVCLRRENTDDFVGVFRRHHRKRVQKGCRTHNRAVHVGANAGFAEQSATPMHRGKGGTRRIVLQHQIHHVIVEQHLKLLFGVRRTLAASCFKRAPIVAIEHR